MKLLKKVEDLTIDARIEDDKVRKEQILNRAVKILDENKEKIFDRAEYYYLKGYCWYQMPFDSKEKDENIETNLIEALVVDPHHQFAILYLAHFYFDKKKYSKALIVFKDIEIEYFREIGQPWRVLKIRELIICCNIRLKMKESDTFSEIISFLSDCIKVAIVNDEDLPFPFEFVITLYEHLRLNSYDEKFKEIIFLTIKLIDLLDIKSVHHEYLFFTQFVQSGL